MATYQVTWNALSREVVIQNDGASPLEGFLVAGKFEDSNGPFFPNLSDVLFHAVRDALYFQGVYDMQRIKILGTPPAPIALGITGPTSLSHQSDQAFTQQYQRIGGTGPYTWSLVGATAGITINQSGLVGITNTLAVDEYEFTVRVTDSLNAVANRNVQLNITDEPVVVDTRKIWFLGPANAYNTNTQSLMAAGTRFGQPNTKAGTLTVNTTAGNYAWIAIPTSLVSAGVTFNDGTFDGDWTGAGYVGNREDTGVQPVVGGPTVTFNGTQFTLYRQDWMHAHETGPGNWTLS